MDFSDVVIYFFIINIILSFLISFLVKFTNKRNSNNLESENDFNKKMEERKNENIETKKNTKAYIKKTDENNLNLMKVVPISENPLFNDYDKTTQKVLLELEKRYKQSGYLTYNDLEHIVFLNYKKPGLEYERISAILTNFGIHLMEISEIVLRNRAKNLEKENKIINVFKNNGENTESFELNDEKKKIFEELEDTNDNYFITGKAGTGKSYLLKYFQQNTKKKVLFAAPTGISALNISGMTLHKLFGSNNLELDKDICLSNIKSTMLKHVDTIVIDEISMVGVSLLYQIDLILQNVRRNALPFGGVQMIFFGDLFQLPPVYNDEQNDYLRDRFGGIYFFFCDAYKNGNFHFRELKEVFRQKDSEFIDLLNNVRVGKITSKQIDMLNSRYVEDIPNGVMMLVPTRREAENINNLKLDAIESPEFTYNADFNAQDGFYKKKNCENDFPCSLSLKLKKGALIMYISNDDFNSSIVNGSIGVVSDLSENGILIVINGTEYQVNKRDFHRYDYSYNRELGKIERRIVATVSQYPIVLAYAITIHKSQGKTYQQIGVNFEKSFAAGQVYVALSRCANFDKLYLTSKFEGTEISVDETITTFYDEISKKNQ